MDWPEGREIALDTCKNIGGQLVREWYESERPGADVGIAVEKFALGGGGFASTVFFKRSVPMVCLPMFWLDGKVVYNGKEVRWRPLLIDSRRIRDHSLQLY